ncbi:MAG: aminotransferase class I/II-fold pyridoxal phosphate-dependent enzyme [Planctomycetaceae bacterium]
MSVNDSDVDSVSPQGVTDRVRSYFDPATVGALAVRLGELLQNHFEKLSKREGPVLNWNLPESNIAAAVESLKAHQGGDVPQRFEQLVQLAFSKGHNLHHPRYVGHQVPASVPAAGLFDAIASVTNQVMAIYEMGPWATAVERALVDMWATQIGLQPGTFAGFVTNGGSLANLTALLTARNVVLGNVWESGFEAGRPQPVLVVQSDAHYCVARSAGILGIGTENIRRVPLDERRRMDVGALREILGELKQASTPVVAVVAAACATPIGAFDPLDEIADVCEEFDVWMHVDAAHGGATAFSDTHRHLISGLERADSFICDAHKTLFVPALCAFVFYKNREHRFETFRQEAPYLFDPSAPGMAEYDGGLLTIECTKHAATYGMWGITALYGKQLFGDLIDHTFALTRRLYELLSEADDFVTLHEPQCNIQVFRYHPTAVANWNAEQVGNLNRQIRRSIIESGEFYLVQTTDANGAGALRVCLMNPMTEEGDLRHLLDHIRKVGDSLINNASM